MPGNFQGFQAFGPDKGRIQDIQAIGGQHGEHLVEGNFTINDI
jgi:hypothetical protein